MTHFKDATELEFTDRNFQIFAWAFISQVKNFYAHVAAVIPDKHFPQKLCPHLVIFTGAVKTSKHIKQLNSSASIFRILQRLFFGRS